MQYQIYIDIDSKGLQKIYSAGQFVTLVKSGISDVMARDHNNSETQHVVWIAFQPLETNLVSWIENYYLYATTTVLRFGNTITMNSVTDVPVQTGWIYTFEQGHFKSNAGSGDTFNAENQMNEFFSFGLAQQATVNNISTIAPLNAVTVLFNEEAIFSPQEQISIFLSSCNNGSLINQVPGNALTVALTSQQPVATVGFNDVQDTFYLISGGSMPPSDFARRVRRIR